MPRRLLLIIHHLVVDGVSWRILLEDLQTAYQQLSRKETMQLPANNFVPALVRVREYAHSAQLQQRYWLDQSQARWNRLPVDYPGQQHCASTQQISTSLSVEETQALLQEVPKAYNTQINDVLLTALVQALPNGRAIALSSGSGRPRTGKFSMMWTYHARWAGSRLCFRYS